jgi:transcriptional regulator with XRE-family HTH domain
MHLPDDLPTEALPATALGDLLREARERRCLTLAEVSSETKIPRRHLEALERGNLAALPEGIYRRGEIRAYARAVHLDEDLALSQLERALQPLPPVEPAPEVPRRERPAAARGPAWRVRGITVSLVAVGVVGILGGLAADALIWRGVWGRDAAPGIGMSRTAANAESERSPVVPEVPLLVPTDAPNSPAPVALPPLVTSDLPPMLDAAGAGGRAALPEAPPAAPLAGPRRPGGPEAQGEDAGNVLVVRTQPPGSRVTVNGIGWGTTPVTIRYLPPGDKRVRVSQDGYASEERVLSLGEGQRATLDIRLREAD